MSNSLTRTRWAAIGAAVAVTLGTGGLFTASAAIGSGDRAVYVPITPCRIMDTRPGTDNVGPRSTPIGVGETHTIQVRSTCTIPTDAVSVTLNVTALNSTSDSFLTVYPADAATRPTASSLNWRAGQAPTPNAVTAKLAADGQLSFYNLAGTVDVITDVVGYYADHNHDDRYYTKAQVDARLTGKADSSALAAKANTTDVNAALAAKANTTDVNTALAGKADKPASGSAGIVLVSPTSFIPDDDTYDFFYNFNGFLIFDVGSGCFAAPVSLPSGATVTKVTLDGETSVINDFTITLIRDPAGATASTDMARVSGPGAVGPTTLTTETITQPVVDNAANTYFVSLCMSDASVFYSARIDYTNP